MKTIIVEMPRFNKEILAGPTEWPLVGLLVETISHWRAENLWKGSNGAAGLSPEADSEVNGAGVSNCGETA